MSGLVKGLIAVMVVGGFLSLAGGLWLPAKAVMAQFLLQKAWVDAKSLNEPVKPWPWADTWPMGRLIQKRLGVDEIILQGSNGEALAFGPGHLTGSAPPGEDGHCVAAGHRDTSFAFLEKLQVGDVLLVEGLSGLRTYRVQRAEVIEAQDLYLNMMQRDLLTLITCYPFRGILPNTSSRFVITAEYAQ